jgi:Ca2+-binding EF-hand superfamily protein
MFHYYKEKNRVIGDVDRKRIKEAFIKYSSKNDGLSKTDYKVAWIYLFGYKPTKYDVTKVFAGFNKSYENDEINLMEFQECAIKQIKKQDAVEEMRNAFIAIDFSCKGFLTIDDLANAFKIVAPNISIENIKNVFSELDRDFDDRISFKDFEFALQYNNDE